MSRIALVIGSLAKSSINRAIAEHVAARAPAGVHVEEVQIADLPLYTQDLDSQSIPAYARVRAQIKAADGVLVFTPEHNRAMPAALKNLIDIASRPWGQSVWAGKKVAIAAATVGVSGAAHAALQVRQSLQLLQAQVQLAPEVFIDRAGGLVAEGKVTDARTAEFLDSFAAGFYAWVAAS